MIKKIFLIILVNLAIIACEYLDSIKIDVSLLHKNFFSDTSKVYHDNVFASIEVEYYSLRSSDSISVIINNNIYNFVKEAVGYIEQSEDGENKNSVSLQEQLHNFTNSFDDYMEEFKDNRIPWKITVTGKNVLITNKRYCQSFNSYYQTGGAHPNSFETFLNFDLINGEKLHLENLFTTLQLEQIKNITESYFRKQHKIADNVKLTDAGFWFNDEKFYLAQNWGITDSTIIFIYNPYEIAPYALGKTKIEVPLAEIYK